MSLEIQRGKSPYWYARIKIDGRRVPRALTVRVAGVVPPSLKELGDLAFERSRAQAQAEHDRMVDEARKKRSGTDWLETIYESKTGSAVPAISLNEMSLKWRSLGSRREAYIAQAEAMHKQFITFLSKNYPSVREMADVREEMATGFMAGIEAQGLAPATYNRKLDYLRSCFNGLAKQAGLVTNPFDHIEEQEEEIINRQPFSAAELETILGVVQHERHAFIRPVLILAINTAMRRADCCLLKKSAINRSRGMITVRTAKTRKPVTIPISTKLAELLDSTPSNDSPYVFPECARQFLVNPKLITERTRAVLRDAGFFNQTASGPAPVAETHIEREEGRGVRRASTRDFQSFRATWVTLALVGGVPIEMVCMVTGHTSAETLRKHYFLPGFEDFRRIFEVKLPTVIGGKSAAPVVAATLVSTIIEKLRGMTESNWAAVRGEIIAILPTLSGAYKESGENAVKAP